METENQSVVNYKRQRNVFIITTLILLIGVLILSQIWLDKTTFIYCYENGHCQTSQFSVFLVKILFHIIFSIYGAIFCSISFIIFGTLGMIIERKRK